MTSAACVQCTAYDRETVKKGYWRDMSACSSEPEDSGITLAGRGVVARSATTPRECDRFFQAPADKVQARRWWIEQDPRPGIYSGANDPAKNPNTLEA